MSKVDNTYVRKLEIRRDELLGFISATETYRLKRNINDDGYHFSLYDFFFGLGFSSVEIFDVLLPITLVCDLTRFGVVDMYKRDPRYCRLLARLCSKVLYLDKFISDEYAFARKSARKYAK